MWEKCFLKTVMGHGDPHQGPLSQCNCQLTRFLKVGWVQLYTVRGSHIDQSERPGVGGYSPYSTEKRDPTPMKSTRFALGTQRDLYSTCSCWGLALGVKQILAFAYGVTQILAFLDTNILNSHIGGLDQREATTQEFCVAVEYRFIGKPLLNVLFY